MLIFASFHNQYEKNIISETNKILVSTCPAIIRIQQFHVIWSTDSMAPRYYKDFPIIFRKNRHYYGMHKQKK